MYSDVCILFCLVYAKELVGLPNFKDPLNTKEYTTVHRVAIRKVLPFNYILFRFIIEPSDKFQIN